ncbi:MAG: hypothetical protein HDT27_07450 [Subdoligranulum sp.]|nr:hypothetical protein [Subdoligranulum sp.]
MRERLDVGQALERGRSLPYALIRWLSRVSLGPTPDRIDLSELTEARFFGPDEEVRIFLAEDGLQAARFWKGAEDTVIEHKCALANKAIFGESVTVQQFLNFDGDGQAAIDYTRLSDWKGGC